MKVSSYKLSCAVACVVIAGVWLVIDSGFARAQAPASEGGAWTNFSARVTPEMAAFGSRGVRVHDPSTIVKCKDDYWVFYTGRGVPCYHSKDLTNWEAGPRVFSNAPAWVGEDVPEHRGIGFWAPDVMKVGDRYLLYYAISTFGKKVSAIGLATNPTLDPNDPAYKWTDEGEVIRSTETNNFNTIDPAICQEANGNLWMVFGSYWSGIKLIQLDPKTGKRIAPDSRMYSLAHYDSIEASYIYHHDKYYYLFVNWGSCCKGTNSTYNIRIGRSETITGPYLDQNGTDMFHGGGTLFLESEKAFVGPGHAGIITANGTDWLSCHYYDGTRGGTSVLSIQPLRWSTNGWPEVVHRQ